MKVGDVVQIKDGQHNPHSGNGITVGLITDCFEDANGFWMYEVTSFDPPDRGWFPDLSLIKMKNNQKDS